MTSCTLFPRAVGYRPRRELVELVESGRIKPGRAIDLGSGTASNVIYLAQHGFDALGVDFSPAAVENGRRMAQTAASRPSLCSTT